MIDLIKNFPINKVTSIVDHLNLNKMLDDFFEISFNSSESAIDTTFDAHYKNEVESDGLNTFYADILLIEELLGDAKHIVDVGAGYCRVGLMLAIRNPNLKITCIENQPSRVSAALMFKQHYQLDNLEIKVTDIQKVENLDADIFFFYFPVCEKLRQFFLNNINLNKSSIIAIESHGDFFDFLETDFPGIEVIGERSLIAPRLNPYIKKWRLVNKEKFNKVHAYANGICDHLKLIRKVEFSYVDDSNSSVLIDKLRLLSQVRIEFTNGDIVELSSLSKCYFELYQLESNSPRRVYKFNQITRLLL